MSKDSMGQDQIDAMFDLYLNEGGKKTVEDFLKKDEEKIAEYDFNRPDKFNPENVRSLVSILKGFAKNLTLQFLTNLRLPVKISLETPIEQVPYGEEYVDKVSRGDFIFCVVDLGGEELGKIIVELDVSLVIPITQSYLGAENNIEIEEDPEPLTDLGIENMEEWIQDLILQQLKEAFRTVSDMEPKVVDTKSDPGEAKVTASNDMVVVIGFNVEINNKIRTMRLILPFFSIEPIINKLTTENVIEIELKDRMKDREEIIKSHLKETTQIIEVELGKTKLNLKELKELAVGDLIVLETKLENELVGYISGIPKFHCVPGRKGNRTAVKVTGVAKKGGREDGR